MKPSPADSPSPLPGWTFLSNHAHVLLLIARDPAVTLRDAALRVGITERAVQRIVADLEEAGYLERHREGRRNRYRLHPELPLRHPIEAHTQIGELVGLVLRRSGPPAQPAPPRPRSTPRRRG